MPLQTQFPITFWKRNSASTYYVDATLGSDSANGTSALTPWKTVAKVNGTTLIPGDTVQFKCGERWREALIANYSGRSGSPITFTKYGTGANPIIDGSRQFTDFTLHSGSIWKRTMVQGNQAFENNLRLIKKTSVASMVAGSCFLDTSITYIWCGDSGNPNVGHNIEVCANGSCIDINGKDWLVFDGIDVTKAKNNGYNWQDTQGGTHCIVKNCDISWHGLRGVSMGGYSFSGHDNNTFQTITAHDSLGEGIWIGNGANNLVTGCEVWNILTDTEYAKGYTVTANGSGILFGIGGVSNTARNNYVHHIYTNAGIGVEYEATFTRPLNCVIERNRVVIKEKQTGTNAVALSIEGDGTSVINNTIESTVRNAMGVDFGGLNNTFYHNTIYAGFTWGMVYNDDCGINNIFKNNIIFRSSGTGIFYAGTLGINGGTLDYNLYDPVGTYQWSPTSTFPNSLSGWQTASGQESHSVSADPLFVSASTSDFHLFSASPAIDAGTNVGVTADKDGLVRPQAVGYDIGAYEGYTQVTPSPTIAFVQSKTGTARNATIVVTLDAAPIQNNILIAFISQNNVPRIFTPGTGWTKLTQIESADSACLWWKIAGASESATQTICTSDTTVNVWAAGICEYSGCATTSPIEAETANIDLDATKTTTGTADPTDSVERLVVGAAMSSIQTTYSVQKVNSSTAGVTERVDLGVTNVSATTITMFDKFVVSTVTGNYTAEAVAASNDPHGSAHIAIVKAA